MAELPSGTISFLFTDLEDSTRRWQEHPDSMREALARHDAILHGVTVVHDGHIVKTTGDGVLAAFATASDAVDANMSYVESQARGACSSSRFPGFSRSSRRSPRPNRLPGRYDCRHLNSRAVSDSSDERRRWRASRRRGNWRATASGN
jgi:class 3 adenylate cyclase